MEQNVIREDPVFSLSFSNPEISKILTSLLRVINKLPEHLNSLLIINLIYKSERDEC
ncbi:hypothetical protein [uncultured Pontibacter sp.]|uniref:hypothetical protein n=1 Tax=uncultured Pontibacter sp. TaxID=453356 RepID=UPI00262812D3|nr:hypothetical protein [uncultured Pontibacter sp.]